jgi:hypothetical protein
MSETGLPMSPISPNSFAGAVDSWSVSPTLPNGLSLDSSTGTISGTPTTITPSQTQRKIELLQFNLSTSFF